MADSPRAGGRDRQPRKQRDDRAGVTGRPHRAGGQTRGTPELARGGDRRSRSSRPAAGSARQAELEVPAGADPRLLDRPVRAELRSLSKPKAEAVAGHLVAAGQLVDTDPNGALAHAKAARAIAGRLAAVREAVGLAAYHAEQWAEALTELRAARRISGDPRNLAVLADCERALGRPEQAARLLSDPDVRRLDAETKTELLIVVAGARRDLGQLDAALAVLARGGLDRDDPRPGAARLWYAYADALVAAGRPAEAAQWFAASAGQDPEGLLDAAERAADLL